MTIHSGLKSFACRGGRERLRARVVREEHDLVTPFCLQLRDERLGDLVDLRRVHVRVVGDRFDRFRPAVLLHQRVEEVDVDDALRRDQAKGARLRRELVVTRPPRLLPRERVREEVRDQVDGRRRVGLCRPPVRRLPLDLLRCQHARGRAVHDDLGLGHLGLEHGRALVLVGRVDHDERLHRDHLDRVGALRGLVGARRLDELVHGLASPRLVRAKGLVGVLDDLVEVTEVVGPRAGLARGLVHRESAAGRALGVGHRFVAVVHDDLHAVLGHAGCGRAAVVLALGPRVDAQRPGAHGRVVRALRRCVAGLLRECGLGPDAHAGHLRPGLPGCRVALVASAGIAHTATTSAPASAA